MSERRSQERLPGSRLRVERLEHGVHHLILARPEARNALDAALLRELTDALERLASLPAQELRVLVLRGEGGFLCAGADLGEMRALGGQGSERDGTGAVRLPGVLRRLAAMPVPVVGLLQGAAMGGGVGLLACCDLVIAEETAVVALPEVRLGLLPAVIGPYLLRRVGLAEALALALDGRRRSAADALRMRLVNQVVKTDELAGALQKTVAAILRGGPQALRRTKALYLQLSPLPTAAVETLTAATLAEARASEEARAGIDAFLERRGAPWLPEPEKTP